MTGQIRQLAEHLVRFYRFVRNGVLIAVAVKMYCDALCPMRIQGNTLSGVFRREFILVGNLISALCRIEPTVENITGAYRVFQLIRTGFTMNIVIVASHGADAGRVCASIIVKIYCNRDLFTVPCRIEIVCRTIGSSFVADGRSILNRARSRTFPLAPTSKIIAIAGKGVDRKFDFLVVNSIQRYLFANTVAGVQHDDIPDRRPLCRIGHIAADHGFRRQFGFAVEPALKGVAFFRRVGGNLCTDGSVLCNIGRAPYTAIIKCHRIGVAPDGIEIDIVFCGDFRAGGVDHCAIFSGRPACKHLAGVGEGVRRQRTLAAVDVLGVVITRTAIGMESDNDRRGAGEIAQVYAVVVFITAAVLRILNHQLIAFLSCSGVACPFTVTTDSICDFGIAQSDRAFVVIFL